MEVLLRYAIVAFAFVVERLRRLPGMQALRGNELRLSAALLLGAFVAFVVWGLERTPQPVTLADLRAGRLPARSSWIIISGEMVAEAPRASGLVYRLTDGTAANSWMLVHSDAALPVGRTTVSGIYFGQRDLVPEGYAFIGQMQADPVTAPQQPPPWPALALAAAGLVLAAAARASYPTFFAETPGRAGPGATTGLRATTVRVDVQSGTGTTAAHVVPGTVRLEPGAPVELAFPGVDEPLPIYRAYTSIEVGELRRLTTSEPVLRVRRPVGDVDIIFSSREHRDATFALAAQRPEPLASLGEHGPAAALPIGSPRATANEPRTS